jgi:hypothetical protein
MQNYTLKELYEAAKQLNIVGRSCMNKSQLQNAVRKMIKGNKKQRGGGSCFGKQAKPNNKVYQLPQARQMCVESTGAQEAEKTDEQVYQDRCANIKDHINKMKVVTEVQDLKKCMLSHIQHPMTLNFDHNTSIQGLIKLIETGILTTDGQSQIRDEGIADFSMQRAYICGSFFVKQKKTWYDVLAAFRETGMCVAASHYMQKNKNVKNKYNNLLIKHAKPCATDKFEEYIAQNQEFNIERHIIDNHIAVSLTRSRYQNVYMNTEYKDIYSTENWDEATEKFDNFTGASVDNDTYNIRRFTDNDCVDFCIWEPCYNYNYLDRTQDLETILLEKMKSVVDSLDS